MSRKPPQFGQQRSMRGLVWLSAALVAACVIIWLLPDSVWAPLRARMPQSSWAPHHSEH